MSDSCCSNKSNTVSYFETIGLFHQLNSSKTTTLYDSTCGLPLFTVPIGRSFEEWKDDCEENGQLRFQENEFVSDNVKVQQSGKLVSICGTRVGEYVSSSHGVNVYSVNIACISGLPIQGVTTSTVLNGSAFTPGSLIDPGNATSFIGVIILASLGGVLFLLSCASCLRWWRRKQAQYWCNEEGPLGLLFLDDEKLSSDYLETEYTISVTSPHLRIPSPTRRIPSPNRVYYEQTAATVVLAPGEVVGEPEAPVSVYTEKEGQVISGVGATGRVSGANKK